MLKTFTIVANEVIGLSATECTLMQFSYNPEQIHDPRNGPAQCCHGLSQDG